MFEYNHRVGNDTPGSYLRLYCNFQIHDRCLFRIAANELLGLGSRRRNWCKCKHVYPIQSFGMLRKFISRPPPPTGKKVTLVKRLVEISASVNLSSVYCFGVYKEIFISTSPLP